MRLSESINFDNFKKKDHAKEAQIASTKQHMNKTVQSRLSQHNFHSVHDLVKTMPIAEPPNQSRLDLPKVKGLKDTMQMMITNYQGQSMSPDMRVDKGEVTVGEKESRAKRHVSMMS